MAVKRNEANDADGSRERGTLRVHLVVSSPRSSRIYDLVPGRVLVVGRSSDAHVTIDDAMVSRVHLQIERLAEGVHVQDRGSANGTWVNGAMLKDGCVIRPGDEVKIGATVLTVVEASPLPVYRRSLVPEDELRVRLGYELERARLHGVPLGVVLVDPPAIGVDEENVVQRLTDVMGPGDVLGRVDDGALAVVLPEGSRQRTEALVRGFMDLAIEGSEGLRGIGVAVFPGDGMDSRGLLAAARRSAQRREWRKSLPPPDPEHDEHRAITVVDGISSEPDPGQSFIVRDPSMMSLIKLARKVAASDVPALITGETGSGKEVLAKYIHTSSSRVAGPFVKVNCAALPPAVIESELFGHEKGSFTGADERRIGYFETASGGTLMLDEITELPQSIQVKLLRFLDDYTITRVGRSEELRIDVRVLALTNRDVEQEVRAGRLRQDLYYRLGTFVLFVPPLRSRLEDIPVLARYFAARAARRAHRAVPLLSDAYIEGLFEQQWPGNVRELRNAVEGSLIRAEGEEILPEHLPEFAGGGNAPPALGLGASPIRQRREEAEAEEIRKALVTTDGNQTAAARILGVSRRTLWSKIRQYGIRLKKVD